MFICFALNQQRYFKMGVVGTYSKNASVNTPEPTPSTLPIAALNTSRDVRRCFQVQEIRKATMNEVGVVGELTIDYPVLKRDDLAMHSLVRPTGASCVDVSGGGPGNFFNAMFVTK
jgi:hypothetical protein